MRCFFHVPFQEVQNENTLYKKLFQVKGQSLSQTAYLAVPTAFSSAVPQKNG